MLGIVRRLIQVFVVVLWAMLGQSPAHADQRLHEPWLAVDLTITADEVVPKPALLALATTKSYRLFHPPGNRRVWVLPGRYELPNFANQGQVVSSLLLCTGRGPLIVDPGAHGEIGTHWPLIAHRLCRDGASASPASGDWLVTRAAPEISIAASVIQAWPMWASAETTQAMTERCPRCWEQLSAAIGPERLQGAAIRVPDHPLQLASTLAIALGREPDGVLDRIQLMQIDLAPGESQVLLWDVQHQWLFAPGLVYAPAWPRLHEHRWLRVQQVLRDLAAGNFAWVITAGGVEAGADAIATSLSDLRQMLSAINQELAQGRDAAGMVTRLSQSGAFRSAESRPLFAERFARGVQALTQQREAELFDE